MDAFVVADCIGLGQPVGTAIDPAVNPAPLNRVGRIGPLALHLFEIGQARAVLEFIDHPRRHIGLVLLQGRRGQRQFGLLFHCCGNPRV